MRTVWMTMTILVALSAGSDGRTDEPGRPATTRAADGSGQASDDGRSVAERFAAIDADGDGRIEKGEARAALERLFARMDKDQSGRVTPDEFTGFHLPGSANPDQKAFGQVDLDGDGRVEQSEYLEVGIDRFQATDVDGEPGISLAEYRAFSG